MWDLHFFSFLIFMHISIFCMCVGRPLCRHICIHTCTYEYLKFENNYYLSSTLFIEAGVLNKLKVLKYASLATHLLWGSHLLFSKLEFQRDAMSTQNLGGFWSPNHWVRGFPHQLLHPWLFCPKAYSKVTVNCELRPLRSWAKINLSSLCWFS